MPRTAAPLLPHRFAPGNRGRPKGSPNRATVEARAMATRLVQDPAYLRRLQTRLRAGKALHMEPVLWWYAYGKPKERVTVEGEVTLGVSAIARRLRERLRALPVERGAVVREPAEDGT